MKKTILYSFAILGLLSAVYFLFGFRAKPDKVAYQYIFIISEHPDLDGVYINVDGKDYQRLKFTKQTQGPCDMGPLINLIHQYENDGYVLQDFTGFMGAQTCWLRKEK